MKKYVKTAIIELFKIFVHRQIIKNAIKTEVIIKNFKLIYYVCFCMKKVENIINSNN